MAAISGHLVGEFEGVFAKLSVTDAGQLHWGLELQGVSVGSGARVPLCSGVWQASAMASAQSAGVIRGT